MSESEKSQINDVADFDIENNNYVEKMEILRTNTENLIKKMAVGSSDESKRIRGELEKFNSFLDQVLYKLTEIKKEREKIYEKSVEVEKQNEKAGEEGYPEKFKVFRSEVFRSYETICGPKLFCINLKDPVRPYI